MFANPFSRLELDQRLAGFRQLLVRNELDCAVLSAPENIFYLTGLDHWGYFAPHFLIVPVEGEMVLVTRAMERITIETFVRNARFAGHGDDVSPASALIAEIGAFPGRFGAEMSTTGFSYPTGRALVEAIAPREMVDITGWLDAARHVKSPEEQALMRAASRLSDQGMQAAIDALGCGAGESGVAADVMSALTRDGGSPPGFGPFIRPEHRLGEEHTTWGNGHYPEGSRVFIELSGCVARYHAPQGRLIQMGRIRDEDARMAETCRAGFDAVCGALKPGAVARDIYALWQGHLDEIGCGHYRRHHCGYMVGIGFPPSWTGGNGVTGLRHDSGMEIREGMAFHILSWMMGTGRGDFFLSNTVLVGKAGGEVLSRTTNAPIEIARATALSA